MVSTASQPVLVAGGGIGGIATANRLRRRLDRHHRVVLINRDTDFTFAASYLWVMTGARRPAQITRPLRRLERRGIEVVIGDVTDVDPAMRTVTVGDQRLTGDHLVLSLGADWATERIPGLAEHGQTFATLGGAERLAGELRRVETGRIDYQPGRQITAVEPGSLQFGDTNERADLVVYMPPIVAPPVIANSALAADDGWIHADRSTLTTAFPGVYAIGDNTHIVLGIGKPLPRAGVFAHGQAQVVADTISASISGAPTPSGFDGHGGCFIETGGGRAAYGAGNFYADPAPAVALHDPGRRWHWGKVAFEQQVMRRWL